MPEECLYLLYRNAMGEHVTRVGMAQVVRSDPLVPCEAVDITFDEPRDVLAGESVCFPVVSNIVKQKRRFGRTICPVTIVKIFLDIPLGDLGERHKAFFIAFPVAHRDDALLEVQVTNAQVDEFRDPQPACEDEDSRPFLSRTHQARKRFLPIPFESPQ